MFLAFKIQDLIRKPFGWLLGFLYQMTGNYGVAMILFGIAVYMVLLPVTAKSKKSMMKMSRLQPQLQEIQRRYADDQQKQGMAMQQLYKDEGVSMYGSCLWSFVPLLILWPLFTVIREPMVYLLGVSSETATQIIDIIKSIDPSIFGNAVYDQVVACQAIPQFANQIQAAIPDISATVLEGINFRFLGRNLGSTPTWQFWSWGTFDWPHIGLALIPFLSAGSQMLQSKIMMKMNNSVVTNANGVQDEETAQQSAMAQSNKTMMWMMPIMSLFIGYSVSAGLSIYWLVGGVTRTIQDIFLTKHYRKVYDAEDAIRLQKAMERDAIEAEKERVRAERRAANPDGITANTSKKKLQKAAAEKAAAEKAAATKEYNAKRGIFEEEKPEKETLSGIADRPYCKGRAYEADRYSRNTEE